MLLLAALTGPWDRLAAGELYPGPPYPKGLMGGMAYVALGCFEWTMGLAAGWRALSWPTLSERLDRWAGSCCSWLVWLDHGIGWWQSSSIRKAVVGLAVGRFAFVTILSGVFLSLSVVAVLALEHRSCRLCCSRLLSVQALLVRTGNEAYFFRRGTGGGR